jgi:hypothetical protein
MPSNRRILKINLPTLSQHATARMSPKHLYLSITLPGHPAGVTATISPGMPTGPLVRHKPVTSTASALKSRATTTQVKPPKRKREDTPDSPFIAKQAPPAKYSKVSATGLFDKANTSAGALFSVAQVSWARAMLISYIHGLESFKNTLALQLEELFPHLSELDIDQGGPLPEDPVRQSIIQGALTYEADHQATTDETERADEPSIAAIGELLGEVEILRYVIRGAQTVIQDAVLGCDEVESPAQEDKSVDAESYFGDDDDDDDDEW